MQTRFHPRRIAIAIGAAVAMGTVGTAIAVAEPNPSNEPAPPARSVSIDQSDVAAWVAANGLTGPSPVSLRATPVRSAGVDQSAVAAWAAANGLSGLSPSSLDHIDD